MLFLEAIVGMVVDNVVSKLIEFVKRTKRRHNDKKLQNTLRRELLDCYGNEPFYNDLDSYLTRNKTIDYLVFSIRNPTLQKAVGRAEFVETNCDHLLSETFSCCAYSSQIKDVFVHIYDQLISTVTEIDPYSDHGRLLSSVYVQCAEQYAEIRQQVQANSAKVDTFESILLSFQNDTSSRNSTDFNSEVKDFKGKAKKIEEYRYESRFEEAFSQYECNFNGGRHMDYLTISLEDAWAMARRHGCDLIESSDFDDDLVPVWASNNYNDITYAPGDVDELCGHICFTVGAYRRGVISQEVYLRAMRFIDHRLKRHYRTSLETEWRR